MYLLHYFKCLFTASFLNCFEAHKYSFIELFELIIHNSNILGISYIFLFVYSCFEMNEATASCTN